MKEAAEALGLEGDLFDAFCVCVWEWGYHGDVLINGIIVGYSGEPIGILTHVCCFNILFMFPSTNGMMMLRPLTKYFMRSGYNGDTLWE